mgnify:CR=1 FL=1
MTQEEKNLLLKDLCPRLPYNIRLYTNFSTDNWAVLTPVVISNLMCATDDMVIKPYLRPMSSMTEEELDDLKRYVGLVYGHPNDLDLSKWDNGHTVLEFWLEEVPHYVVVEVFDWLNVHHFDYRGLIEKDLALEAPEGIYSSKH